MMTLRCRLKSCFECKFFISSSFGFVCWDLAGQSSLWADEKQRSFGNSLVLCVLLALFFSTVGGEFFSLLVKISRFVDVLGFWPKLGFSSANPKSGKCKNLNNGLKTGFARRMMITGFSEKSHQNANDCDGFWWRFGIWQFSDWT